MNLSLLCFHKIYTACQSRCCLDTEDAPKVLLCGETDVILRMNNRGGYLYEEVTARAKHPADLLVYAADKGLFYMFKHGPAVNQVETTWLSELFTWCNLHQRQCVRQSFQSQYLSGASQTLQRVGHDINSFHTSWTETSCYFQSGDPLAQPKSSTSDVFQLRRSSTQLWIVSTRSV